MIDKTVRIFKIVGFVLIILAIIQVVISNRLVTAGQRLTQIDKEIKRIEEENEYLKKEIASFSSLTTIAKEAEKAGFLRMQSFLYLTEETFALKTSP